MADPWSNLRCYLPKSEMLHTALACCTALALVGATPAAAQYFVKGEPLPPVNPTPARTTVTDGTLDHLVRLGIHFPNSPPAPQSAPPPPPAVVMHPVIKPHTHVIHNDPGGWIHEYHDRYVRMAAQDNQVEVRGLCASACTLVVAHVPKARLCFGANAYLMFHKASTADGKPSNVHSQWMIDQYPADIRHWVVTVMGGVEQMPVANYWAISAPILWKLGYRRCAN